MSCSIYVSRSLYQFQVHGRAPPRTGVHDQMEQLFTNRKFHFCYHRNFRVFFLNGKRPRARIWRQTSLFHLICIKFGSKKFVVYETGLNICEHCRPYMTDFFVSQVTLKEFLFYINFRFHVCSFQFKPVKILLFYSRSRLNFSIKWDGISLLNNFECDEKGIRAWRAFDVGPGN